MKAKKLSICLLLMLVISGNLMTQCYVGDCKSGYGIFRYQNNSWYQGFWVNGQPDGVGIKVHHKGVIQEGMWESGSFIENTDVSKLLHKINDSLSMFYNDSELSPQELIGVLEKDPSIEIKEHLEENENSWWDSLIEFLRTIGVPLAIIASILAIINHGSKVLNKTK